MHHKQFFILLTILAEFSVKFMAYLLLSAPNLLISTRPISGQSTGDKALATEGWGL